MKVLYLLWLAVVAWAAFALLALLVADRLIFQPPPPSYGAGDLPITHVAVDGGSVAVLYLPVEGASHTVLFSHGNAEDLGHLQPVLAAIRHAGYSVLAWDYRGYGLSSGPRPTAARAARDAEAVYEHAVGVLGLDPGHIVVHGRSLGSGPALHVAASRPVAGVILESAFTSTYRVLTRVRLLPFDRFRNIDAIRSIDGPVLIIHGTADRVIPVGHGRALHAAARGPRQVLWVEGAGHNDLARVAGDRYVDALAGFRRLLNGVDDAASTKD